MGCGLLATTLLLYMSVYSTTESTLVPDFFVYIFFIVSLLSILKRFQNKKLMIGFILSILCLIFSFINLDNNMFFVIAQLFHYFQIFFVLVGIIEISEGYDWLYKIKKKVKRFLMNLGIIDFLFIYSYITSTTQSHIIKTLIVVLIIQLIGLCWQMLFLNNYLYSLDEPIKLLKPNTRTPKKKMLAIVLIVMSIGIFYLYNENLEVIKYENQNVQFEYYIYSGKSENIIVDSLRYYKRNDSPYYGDYSDDFGYLPTIYLKNKVFEKTHIIDFKLYDEDTREIVKKGSLLTETIIEENGVLLGEERYLVNLDDYTGVLDTFGAMSLNLEKDKDYKLSISIDLLDNDYNVLYQEVIPLQRQSYKEYGYEDNQIEISNVYVTDTSIVYGPTIWIKDDYIIPEDRKYWIYTTFIIDGKEHIYTHSDYEELISKTPLQQTITYASLTGNTITLRIHFIEPTPHGEEFFYKDYVLEELK